MKLKTLYKIAILSLLSLSILSACGKKNPPTPYNSINLKAINDLKAVFKNSSVNLSWTIENENKIDFLILYKAKRDRKKCKTCPLKFKILKKLKNNKQGFVDFDIEKEFSYAYKIKIKYNFGYLSKNSNIVFFQE